MSDHVITAVGGKFSWSVKTDDGSESGMAPSYEQAVEEVEAAKRRLDVSPVILNPKADPNVEHIYHWADRARATVSAVADRPETSKPAKADLSRVQRLLDNILKEIDG